MRKLTISMILAFTLILTFSFQADAASSSTTTVYTIQKGDTLSAVAQKVHVSVQSLIAANQLVNPNSLSIGQKINIPETATSAAAKPAVQTPEKYLVKSGDTLSTIAQAKRVSMNSIIELNKLASPNQLSIGQALLIPVISQTAVASRSDDRRDEPDEDQVDALIHYAKSLLGSPYSYGADGPSAYDCSGFTMTAFKKVGIDLPHSSAQQSKKGTAVKKSDLKTGDLLFFNTSGGGISHVGIYIGHGDFIHASSGQGEVTITDLDSTYYAARYVKARRIL